MNRIYDAWALILGDLTTAQYGLDLSLWAIGDGPLALLYRGKIAVTAWPDGTLTLSRPDGAPAEHMLAMRRALSGVADVAQNERGEWTVAYDGLRPMRIYDGMQCLPRSQIAMATKRQGDK